MVVDGDTIFAALIMSQHSLPAVEPFPRPVMLVGGRVGGRAGAGGGAVVEGGGAASHHSAAATSASAAASLQGGSLSEVYANARCVRPAPDIDAS